MLQATKADPVLIAEGPAPTQKRQRLGTNRKAQRRGLDYVYLGYWVAGSQKMDYKRRFPPIEAYGPSGWTRILDLEDA